MVAMPVMSDHHSFTGVEWLPPTLYGLIASFSYLSLNPLFNVCTLYFCCNLLFCLSVVFDVCQSGPVGKLLQFCNFGITFIVSVLVKIWKSDLILTTIFTNKEYLVLWSTNLVSYTVANLFLRELFTNCYIFHYTVKCIIVLLLFNHFQNVHRYFNRSSSVTTVP